MIWNYFRRTNIFLLIFGLFLFSSSWGYAKIEPNVTEKVVMSNISINRVVCPSSVESIHYSKEYGVNIQVTGQNIFVKFPIQVKKVNGKIEKTLYFDNVVDLHIVCGGNVYTLLLMPKKDVEPKTVYLTDTNKDVKKALSFFKGNSYETNLVNLIMNMEESKIPEGFVLKDMGAEFKYKDIDVTYIRQMKGAGWRVKTFILYSKERTKIRDLEILNFPNIKNPRAVAILDHEFKGLTKAYVVEGGFDDK